MCNYRAAISVHKAQREAVNLLSGNGEAKLATVASVVAAANATAKEAAKSLQLSMKSAALAASSSQKKSKQTGPIMGDFELMQVCYLKPLNVTKGFTGLWRQEKSGKDKYGEICERVQCRNLCNI